MSFNKWFPDRIETEPSMEKRLLWRARAVRYAAIVSTLMLMGGYVVAALAITGRL